MHDSITSDIEPASKAITSNSQTSRFEVLYAHGRHYTGKTALRLSDSDKSIPEHVDLRHLLDHGQQKAKRLYADWRVGATEIEKRAHKRSPSVLLSFDDFGTTEQIIGTLELLARENIRAAFFLQGDWAMSRKALLDKFRQDGHIIGNHTYSHPDLLKLADEHIRNEINQGIKSVWLRPPRGRYDDRVRRIAAELGYAISYWSIDSEDWKGASVEYMSRKILHELHPGAVILFHLHGQNTLALLPDLINDIRNRGYEICSPDEPAWEPQF